MVKRSGKYLLACGHEIKKSIDTQERIRCPKCEADTIVVRVVK